MHSGVKCGDIHTTYVNFMAHWFIEMADYNIKKQIMMGKKLSDVNDSMCWQVAWRIAKM